ncbi:P-loop containing nucleoside triphosphate hydrolase protein [Cladochytrium replicatum]|nr:P-loop containing nucleoside triphosphate hydrolase protein [Cladochytrium replicatum]
MAKRSRRDFELEGDEGEASITEDSITKPGNKKKGDNKKASKQKSASQKRREKRTSEDAELARIEKQCEQMNSILTVLQSSRRFAELPISQPTLKGLTQASFVEMTDIQLASLPHALTKRDILGAAKTGSGKTLAFLIPIFETLYRSKWTALDGLGAIVISPTRELALQIFDALRSVGRYHSFSAGLLIGGRGGKDVKTEKERVGKLNILICTPGRLLQHMDETPTFICDNLKMLVLDEADRVLDMGFEKALNAIIENLPKERQTLLFSATQTKSVKDLARLSLQSPEYVSVHESDSSATPQSLSQRYMVVDLRKKLSVLYSFIRTHLKQKTLIFLSSCKQVRFVHEIFCKLQPGIPLLCLHGKQKQPKRVSIFETFCRKKAIILIATDVAARGLDFPAVDWVVQVDCPESVDTYIHRVGRTARYESSGNALTFLLPSEEAGMQDLWTQRKVPVEQIQMNPAKLEDISGKIAGFCSMDPETKYLGQKAFISYLRSVNLQSNKRVFDVHALPIEEYALSYGLPGAPKIKFVKKSDKKSKKAIHQKTEEVDDDESSADDQPKKTRSKVEKMFKKKNNTVLSEHYSKLVDDDDDGPEDTLHGGDGESDEEFLTVKRRVDQSGEDVRLLPSEVIPPSHKRILREREKALKKIGHGTKINFDEEGNVVPLYELQSLESFESKTSKPLEAHADDYLAEQGQLMKNADSLDKARAKALLKEKKLKKKLKEREKERTERPLNGAAGGVGLTAGDDDEEYEDRNMSDVDEQSEDEGPSWEDMDEDIDNYSEDGEELSDEAMSVDLNEEEDDYGAASSRLTTKTQSLAGKQYGREALIKPVDEPATKKRKVMGRLKSAGTQDLESLALELLSGR